MCIRDRSIRGQGGDHQNGKGGAYGYDNTIYVIFIKLRCLPHLYDIFKGPLSWQTQQVLEEFLVGLKWIDQRVRQEYQGADTVQIHGQREQQRYKFFPGVISLSQFFFPFLTQDLNGPVPVVEIVPSQHPSIPSHCALTVKSGSLRP